MSQINRYALTGGSILCGGAKRVVRVDVLIEGGRISGIGNFEAELVRHDISGCLLFPGFINSHAHPGETIFRNFVSSRSLEEYIEQTESINRLLGSLQESVRAASVDMTLLESIRAGTTTICAGRCAESCDTAGIRSFSGYMLMKSQKLARFLTDFRKHFEDYLRTMKTARLVNPLIFLHSLKFCDRKILELCKKLVREYNIPFTAHVSETENEEKQIQREFGESSVKVLDRYGLIGSRSLLVHCCYVSDDDIPVIKERGATVVLCPTSNLQLGNKPPSLKKFLDADINITIATDGLVTNPSASLIDECLVAARVWPELRNLDLLDFITINPARSLMLNAGVLETGALADMLVFRLNNPKSTEAVSKKRALDIIRSAEIQDVIVDGHFIMKNGQPITLNETQVMKKFEGAREQVRQCIHPT